MATSFTTIPATLIKNAVDVQSPWDADLPDSASKPSTVGVGEVVATDSPIEGTVRLITEDDSLMWYVNAAWKTIYSLSTLDARYVNVIGDTMTGTLVSPRIQFNIAATPATNADGLLQWNATDGTLDLGMSGGDITQQIGQELFMKVRNVSGTLIPNGSPVYVSGRTGNRPNIYLAKSNAESTSEVIGLTTQDIDSPADGFVTTLGYVRQIKTDYSGAGNWGTTWVEGDKLYVSKTVAGQLTNVEPSAPHHSDVVGIVAIVGGAGIGSILVNIQMHKTLEELTDVDGTALTTTGQFPNWNQTAGYFDFDKNINDYLPLSTYNTTNTDTLGPQGWIPEQDWSKATVSIVSTTKLQIVITSPTNLAYYWRGNKTNLGATTLTVTSTIDKAEGLWYCYSMNGTDFVLNQTPFYIYDNISGSIRADLMIWEFYWDNTNNTTIWIQPEFHSNQLSRGEHGYLHEAFGTRYSNGLDITYGLTASNADTRVKLTSGEIHDEDISGYIIHSDTPTAIWEQILGSAGTADANYAALPIYYLSGATPVWRKTTTSSYPFLPVSNNYIYYNRDNAGTWDYATSVGSTSYVVYWIVATTNQSEPIVVIPGRLGNANLTAAQAETFPNLTGLFTEFKLMYRIIYQTSAANSNNGKCKINSVVDYRRDAISNNSSATSTPSAALVSFTPTATIAATNVQAAIEEVVTDADATYLKLDCSNDPLTGDLKLTPTANSTTTLQIFKQDGTTPVLDVDTTNGRVGIGTATPETNLQISGPSVTITDQPAGSMVSIFATDVLANNINKGGSINFGGYYNSNGTVKENYGWIQGAKENSTDANSRGYLRFGTMGVEYMRISSSGEIGFFGAGPTSGRYSFSLAMIGTAARSIGMERHTTANTAGNNLTIQAGGATSAATDKAGGILLLQAGIGTGATRGTVQIGTRYPTTSGTGDNIAITNALCVFSTAADTTWVTMGSGSTTGGIAGNSFNVSGQVVGYFASYRHTTANTAGNVLIVQAGGATSGATDKAGGQLILKSGISTGTGTSQILLQTATPGTTGTSDNSFVTRVTIDNTGATFSGPVYSTTTREKLTANRTYYVRTDGSDSNTGLADSSGGAFLTWGAAITKCKTLDLAGYTVTIQDGSGGTHSYTELVTVTDIIGGNLVLQGAAMTLQETATSATVAAGTTSTKGTVTKTGQFTGNDYQGYWAYFVTDGVYRVIDSNTNDVLTLVGYAPSSTTQDVSIYYPTTIIQNGTSQTLLIKNQDSVAIYDIKFTSSKANASLPLVGTSGIELYNARQITFERVFFDCSFFASVLCRSDITKCAGYITFNGGTVVVHVQSIVWLYGSRFKTSANANINANYAGYINVREQTVIDGGASSACNVQRHSILRFPSTYEVVRNAGVGINASLFGLADGTANNQYSGNTTDESADATSYGYID